MVVYVKTGDDSTGWCNVWYKKHWSQHRAMWSSILECDFIWQCLLILRIDAYFAIWRPTVRNIVSTVKNLVYFMTSKWPLSERACVSGECPYHAYQADSNKFGHDSTIPLWTCVPGAVFDEKSCTCIHTGENSIPSKIKGFICHFVEWQIHPFIFNETRWVDYSLQQGWGQIRICIYICVFVFEFSVFVFVFDFLKRPVFVFVFDPIQIQFFHKVYQANLLGFKKSISLFKSVYPQYFFNKLVFNIWHLRHAIFVYTYILF